MPSTCLSIFLRLPEGESAAVPSFALRLRRPPLCISGLALHEAGGECWGS